MAKGLAVVSILISIAAIYFAAWLYADGISKVTRISDLERRMGNVENNFERLKTGDFFPPLEVEKQERGRF